MSADRTGTTLADLSSARGGDAGPRVDPLATDALDWRSRVVVWVIAA